MDPIIKSENYAMEGPLPDVWFALQVDLVRIYTFWIIFVQGFYFPFQSIMNFTFAAHSGWDWFIMHVKLGHSMDNGFIFKKINKN